MGTLGQSTWDAGTPAVRRRIVLGAYRAVCALELEALKPGNVHQTSDGHGMRVEDFLISAEASAWPLTEPDIGLGDCLRRAAEATREAVGCNTNLGILLLCAPSMRAAMRPDLTGTLRERLVQVLDGCDVRDTEGLFAAIRVASPAGLGTSEAHDVAGPATATPLEVMAEAAGRDQIARQYATGFAELFERGQAVLETLERRWSNPAWAAAGLYMDFLARLPDSHVARKLGPERARRVMERARPIAESLLRAERPEHCRAALLSFDRALKADGVNPGTSADLTVAALLIRRLDPLCSERATAAGDRRHSPSLAGSHAPRAFL